MFAFATVPVSRGHATGRNHHKLNSGAERIFGYSADEALGQSIHLLIPPERSGEEGEIIGRLRRGEPVKHFETQRRTKDGRILDFRDLIASAGRQWAGGRRFEDRQ